MRVIEWRLGLGLGIALASNPGLGWAAALSGGLGTLGTGKLAGYYEDQRQMRWLLEGTNLQAIGQGRFIVSGAKLRTFTPKGDNDMAVEAPQCVADPRLGVISSPGPLHVESFERGRFTLEGQGFQWSTNSGLFISNQVHTTIRGSLLEPGSSSPGAPASGNLEITSHQFNYVTNAGLASAVWRGDVRASGTNLTIASEQLKARFQGHEVESILAETNVTINSAGIQALGPQALYTVTNDLVRMKGRPSWSAGLKEGSSDELTVQPVVGGTNQTLRADGHARLKMPAQTLAASDLLGSRDEGSIGSPRAGQVEIQADSYVLQPASSEFSHHVQLSEWAAGELVGGVDCDRLKATFSGTNLNRMVAEDQVVIRRISKPSERDSAVTTNFLTAGRAEYAGVEGVMELTDHPTWRTGARSGQGDRIWVSVLRKPEEMNVVGHALMWLPAEDLARVGGLEPAGSRPGGTSNQLAEVHCDQYSLASTGGVFQGAVRMTHPQMDWSCRQLTIASPEAAGSPRALGSPTSEQSRAFLAVGDVAFDYVTGARGKKLHGTGDIVTYQFSVGGGRTNEMVALTGNPAILTTENGAISDKTINWDRANARIGLPPKYLIRLEGPPVNTNSLQVASGKSKKNKKEKHPARQRVQPQ